MIQKFGMLSSSMDGTQVANSVRGLILALSALVIYGAGVMGVPLADSDIGELAAGLGAAAGALWTVYGLLMKIVARVSATE